MKKTLAIICLLSVIILSGCQKSNSLDGESSLTSDGSSGESSAVSSVSSDNSATSEQTSATSDTDPAEPPAPYEKIQKISELRGDLDNQINTVKSTEYKNVHTTDDFTVKIPDTDVLYNLTLTTPAEYDFNTLYEKFDRVFDKEFSDIYSEEDKDELYYFYYNSVKYPVKDYIDKLKSGEQSFSELVVETDRAYLDIHYDYTGVYGINHDTMRSLSPDFPKNYVSLTFAPEYFEVTKNYLDVNSDDKYFLSNKEMSIKEGCDAVKKIISENEYSWGGSLQPDVYQVKVLDLNNGNYGFSYTMAPSYEGVIFDTYESPDDFGMSYSEMKTYDYDYDVFPTIAFMLQSDKLESLTVGKKEYTATKNYEIDSVIPLDEVVNVFSQSFGAGMDLQLSRVELLYSGMYPLDDSRTNYGATPVWKFRCYNTTDNFKYVVYVNAVTGKVVFYYKTDWETVYDTQ